MNNFLAGIGVGFALIMLLFTIFPKTKHYHQGILETHKEAYSKGFMVKEIDKDDKVIYKWKESQ